MIYFADDAAEAVMVGQPGYFDFSDRYEVLSAAGDPLERLGSVLDFEVFRGPLIAAFRRSVRGRGGRPPFDPVLMFKILVLEAFYSLSFQRFLGLGLDGTVPDATTVWLFRERLVEAKAIHRLLARLDAALKDRGYLAMGGQIIDATVVSVPKQRNTEAEKAAIKEGRVPEDWKPAKTRQEDRDARWSIKYSKALPVRSSGHTRPTGRRKTRLSWRQACSRVTSARNASRGNRCRNGSPEPTLGDPKSAPRSSMC